MTALKNKYDIARLNAQKHVSPDVKSYENHPFFVAKTERAKKLIERVGLPNEFIERHKPLKG